MYICLYKKLGANQKKVKGMCKVFGKYAQKTCPSDLRIATCCESEFPRTVNLRGNTKIFAHIVKDMLKKATTLLYVLLIIFSSTTLMGNETASKYFPANVGSFWVYEDQDGNELTRRVVEREEIAAEMYHAFEYEPSFENWEDYDYHVHPTLFKVDETGIKFHIGDKIKRAYTKRLTKELEVSFENSRQNMPAETKLHPNFNIDIENRKDFIFFRSL